jgi:hypothetical protein
MIYARIIEHIKVLSCQSVDVHHLRYTCWKEGKDTTVLMQLFLYLSSWKTSGFGFISRFVLRVAPD